MWKLPLNHRQSQRTRRRKRSAPTAQRKNHLRVERIPRRSQISPTAERTTRKPLKRRNARNKARLPCLNPEEQDEKPRNDEQANPMPEKIRTGLCAAVPLLLAVCLAAAAGYRLVNTGAVGWEALGLAAMGAVSVSRNQGKKRDAPPKDFMGEPLPVGDDAADRKNADAPICWTA